MEFGILETIWRAKNNQFQNRQSLLQKKPSNLFLIQHSFSFGIYPEFRYAHLSHFTKVVRTIWWKLPILGETSIFNMYLVFPYISHREVKICTFYQTSKIAAKYNMLNRLLFMRSSAFFRQKFMKNSDKLSTTKITKSIDIARIFSALL